MSDTEKDIEDNNRHENSSDSKNESESKTEESPSKKEESTPQKPLSAAAPKEEQPAPQKAPVTNTEKTKEKDDKKEQQKSKEEADDEQRHTADDKEKDDDTGSEDGHKRQKEFFRAELTRLQRSLKDESSKIHKPKHREHYPFVWTSLEPYYNTYVARFLIDAQEEAIYHPITRKNPAEDPQPGYVSRNTAIGLCDPWTDLRMDRELLPRLETPSKKSRTKAQQNASKKGKKEKPPKQGSTRLPKFPVVDFSSSKENATKCFPYSEVPKFRQEVMGRYKHDAPKKVNADYSRTKDDFYRMDLDRLDEVHPINRQHMRKAYFAYLQNTPGSKKAIKECVKDLNGEQEQKVH